MNFGVSWLYLLVGTIGTMIVGMLWYSPLFFASPWMKALWLGPGDIQESGVPAAPGYLASTLYSLAITYGVWLAIVNLGASSLAAAIAIGLGIWIVTSGLANLRIKYFEDRPWPLYLIDEGYAIVAHLLLAVLAWSIG